MGATSYSEEEDFDYIGKYSPREARRLFEALERANIDFRFEVDSVRAQIDVFIDPAQLYMIEDIKRSLFGEFSP
jgi:hypothetical protein